MCKIRLCEKLKLMHNVHLKAEKRTFNNKGNPNSCHCHLSGTDGESIADMSKNEKNSLLHFLAHTSMKDV